jgi:uncharacterized protein HemX
MGTTGKKFVIALLALAVLLGIGWWVLQQQTVKVSGTVPDTVVMPELKTPEIDTKEPAIDPVLLREISVSLQLVRDSLLLGRDPRPAIEMLSALEARLAGTASPTRLAELRQALAADRQRIIQAPKPDIEAMQATLKRMQAEVNTLPNLFVPHSGSAAATASAAPALATESVSKTYWERIANALGQKLAEVVKVRRVEDRQSTYRMPEQGRLLTEQLRFRVESASAALQMRDAQRLSTELGHAQAILAEAFDADHPAVIAFRESLKELQGQSLSVKLPTPEASMRALDRLIAGAVQ